MVGFGVKTENAVVVSLRPLLMAAERVGLGDHLRALAAARLAAIRQDDPRILARTKAVVAADAARRPRSTQVVVIWTSPSVRRMSCLWKVGSAPGPMDITTRFFAHL